MAETTKITIMIIMSCLMIISVKGQGSYLSTWSTGSLTFSCSDSFDTLKSAGVLNLTLSTGTEYFFGNTNSDSGANPIVARFDDGNKVWCRDDYDESSNIGTAYGGLLDIDNNKLFVVFSTTGSVNGELKQYTRGGWQATYGQANSEEVTVVLELSEETGGPTGRGTYLYPVFNGVTNYARLVEWSKPTADSIEVILQSGPFPLDVNQNPLTCEYFYGNQLYTWTLELTIDLTEVISSESSSCDNGFTSGSSISSVSTQSTGSSNTSNSSKNSSNNSSNTSKTSKTSNTSPKTQSGIFSTKDGTFSRDFSSSSSASSLFFSVFVVVFAAALTVV